MESATKSADFRQELYKRYVSSFKGQTNQAADAGWYRWAQHKLLPLLRGLPLDAAILDVGCGAGQMLQFLKDNGFSNVSGVDISIEQVGLALQRGLNAAARDAVEHLCESPLKFDAIIALDFIEHFEKRELLSLFDTIRAALRPGGRLILQTPNGEGMLPAKSFTVTLLTSRFFPRVP